MIVLVILQHISLMHGCLLYALSNEQSPAGGAATPRKRNGSVRYGPSEIVLHPCPYGVTITAKHHRLQDWVLRTASVYIECCDLAGGDGRLGSQPPTTELHPTSMLGPTVTCSQTESSKPARKRFKKDNMRGNANAYSSCRGFSSQVPVLLCAATTLCSEPCFSLSLKSSSILLASLSS